MFRFSFLAVMVCFAFAPIKAQEKASTSAKDDLSQSSGYKTVRNVLYREDGDDLIKEMCRLDLYYPLNKKNFSTVVWFHGGGLRAGKREIPRRLRDAGIAVVGVDYRLAPKVTVKDCIDDAAASIAWVMRNIEKYGGSKDRVFVSGHSAGGYLTSMVGLDRKWLERYGVDADSLAGLVPFSGHTITHFTARKEMGLKDTQPLIDELAPLTHLRDDAPPLLLITGDRELEMLGRYEENAYMWRMMQVVGHPDTTIHELDGYNHGQMADPAFPLLIRFMSEHSGKERQ